MANMPQAKTSEDLKSMTVSNVKKAYVSLADVYTKVLENDLVYCPHCGSWKSATNFYSSNKTKSGLEHFACKSCILDMATDYDKKSGIRTDNRDKTINVFKHLDLPFIDKDYKTQLQMLNDDVAEKQRSTAFQQLLVMVKSLPNWKGKTFSDSDFGVDDIDNNSEEQIKLNQKTLKSAKKRFGSSYTNEELMFLENEYQDWVSRYECNQKAQEEVFENLSIIKLLKNKALREGKPTKDLDKQQQDWLDTGALKPKQNTLDTFSDAQTMGTLLQKYEETRPLPEIDPELSDVDRIGLYIDAFYRGHASKMLGIKNTFSNLYEKVMAKYTVKPPEYDDETDSEILFDKIFGSVDDD